MSGARSAEREPAAEILSAAKDLKDKNLARPKGLEPLTYCSGGNRSIHLSYGRARSHYNVCGRPAHELRSPAGPFPVDIDSGFGIV